MILLGEGDLVVLEDGWEWEWEWEEEEDIWVWDYWQAWDWLDTIALLGTRQDYIVQDSMGIY